jgi:hypothetical protein
MSRRLSSDRGMAVVSVIILGVIFLSLGVWFMNMSSNQVKGSTHQRHRQRAMDYAESGLEAAEDFLQNPDSLAFDTFTSSAVMPSGRFDYVIVRDTQADSLSSARMIITSTGTFGSNPASAVVESQVDVFDIDEPLVAVPGALKISPGTTAMGGVIYGGDLLFGKPQGDIETQVGTVYYSGTVKTEGESSEEAPSYVVFLDSPPRVQHLGYAPRLPRLTQTVRDFYRKKAAGNFNMMPDPAALDGLVDPPGGGGQVYFAEGDVDVGRLATFRPQGQFIVYVQGTLTVHRSVIFPAGAWVVFLVEKDVVLLDKMSPRCVLMGTYVANGVVRYEGLEHASGSLNVLGGIMAGGGIDLARGWSRGNRRFIHAAAPPGTLPLPHLTQRRQYRILQGKF